ncbi:histone-lysine N-methyltransferase SMYD3 isoform X2 [Ascaphus truei]|uniref:histone-lysine N-methyltransferase SMYD3 isoform X2 n=1 Tax=Ascaphus truei TaxID=8439 RepID=UPI003F5A3821
MGFGPGNSTFESGYAEREMAISFMKFQSPMKGNGLQAARELSLGITVCSEQPYVYTVCKKSQGAVCESCLRRKEKLLRCSQCKFARYCDARCQLEQPDCASEELYSVSNLQSNIKELNDEMKEGLGHLATTLELYLKKEIQDASQLPPGFHILEYFGKVTCNSFTISDGEMQDVGVGLYPSMSLLNHSCDPNCVIVFEGRHILLRTVKEIPMGEELTISYIDVKVNTHMRQNQLQRQYCFICDCHRCQSRDKDTDMLAGDEQASKYVEGSIARLEELQYQNEGAQALDLCKTLMNNNSSRLPDKNIHQLKMLDCAMDACISLGLWEEALHFGTRTLEPYSMYYSSYHPVRAVQVMKVGKLQHHQAMFPEAMQTLKQAFDIMKVTHGRDHSLVQDLIELLGDCEASLKAMYKCTK